MGANNEIYETRPTNLTLIARGKQGRKLQPSANVIKLMTELKANH